MARSLPKNTASGSTTLMVRLDKDSKEALVQAAQLRRISVSDYVRDITVAQARKEVLAAAQQTLALTPEEQLAFWNALAQATKLTNPQKELGRVMRGEA
jgi:uncharacterized protein (DUF1778 family)